MNVLDLLEREWLPVGAFMAAMAVCEVPTDTALEVLRIARVSTDEPPPNQGAVEEVKKLRAELHFAGERIRERDRDIEALRIENARLSTQRGQ